ncbi:MAG: hypothetical protein ACI9UA_006263 [Pseudoalteromonas tetraodonis]|jgi:hypothetical protein
MSDTLDRFEELEKLLSALADDELDVASRERIGEILDGDPEACEFYLDYMVLHAHLEQELGSLAPVQFLEKLPQAQIDEATTIYLATRQPPAPPAWKQPWMAAAAAAVLAGVVLISVMINKEKDRIAYDTLIATDNAVAVLTDSVDAKFATGGGQPVRGDLLPKGLLILESGVARLQFYSGAEVILEGPTEFELLSDNSAACTSGSFRATIPRPAQGFSVKSPLVEMVDLGTAFGANIRDDLFTEVHVFEGEVEVYQAGTNRDPKTRNLLTAGYGLAVAPDGTSTDILAEDFAFITEDEVLQRMRLNATARHDAWQRFCNDTLSSDPHVLAHYPFVSDSTKARILLDKAAVGGLRNGTIIDSHWASGRWPGKRALAFSRPSDRVRIHINKRSPSLTMVAWVKVERLEQRFSALLLTDRLNKNGVEWQITRAGALQFGVRKSSQTTENYISPVVFRDRIGKWAQVAVTLDHEAQKVSHFLNGEVVSTQPLKSELKPAIGSAQIGNWNAPRESGSYPVRNLNGRMDEFLIYDRAIGAEEIRKIYEIGAP